MHRIERRAVRRSMKIRSLVSVAVVLLGASAAACSSSDNGSSSGNTTDGGTGNDSGSDAGSSDSGDAGVSASLSFTPSNDIDLSKFDLSQIKDEDTANSCQIRTDISDCFEKPAYGMVTQSDNSKLAVIVVKSWKVEPTAHITLSKLDGNMPIAIVSLGDVTIQGTIDGHAQDVHASPGGFESVAGQDGSGPGGGPKGSLQFGAAGASYCGIGGKGALVMGSGATPPDGAAAVGAPELVPLRGGASGGAGSGGQGGAGGAGLQLVSGGAFSMTAGSYVNLGGGGGGYDVTGGGGGAGGSLLVEAKTITIAGIVAVNGGGGAGTGIGADSGENGQPNATAAKGGPGTGQGGLASAGTTIDGSDAPAPTTANVAGGGGGAAGRIRLNTSAGKADLSAATMSPAATSICVSQGTLK
jgi:hypothetical protein